MTTSPDATGTTALGRLGLGGQLGLGLRLGLRHYPMLLVVALVVDVPLAVAGQVGQRSGSGLLAFALGLPLVALVNPIGKAATVVAVEATLAGRLWSPWAAYRPVLARLGVVFALASLWLVAVLAGAVALLLPAIVLLVGGQCLMGAAVLERRGPAGAVARSWALVRPAFWSVLALFVVLEVAGGVVGTVVEQGLSMVIDPGGPGGWFVAIAARACTSPFVYATLAVLFLDRRAAVDDGA